MLLPLNLHREKYDLGFKTPNKSGQNFKTGEDMIEMYTQLCTDYSIVSIEQPFDKDDWEHTKLFSDLGICQVPVYARAQDLAHLLDLKKAGATDAIIENAVISLQLGSKLLKGFGVMSEDVTFLSQLVRDSMELQTLEALTGVEDRENDAMKSLQVSVTDMVQDGGGNALKLANEHTLSLKRPDMSQVVATLSEEDQSSDETLTHQPEII